MARLATPEYTDSCPLRCAQRGGNFREYRVDLGAQGCHGGDRAERDQRCGQSIFDQILTGFVVVQAAEDAEDLDFHFESP